MIFDKRFVVADERSDIRLRKADKRYLKTDKKHINTSTLSHLGTQFAADFITTLLSAYKSNAIYQASSSGYSFKSNE